MTPGLQDARLASDSVMDVCVTPCSNVRVTREYDQLRLQSEVQNYVLTPDTFWDERKGPLFIGISEKIILVTVYRFNMNYRFTRLKFIYCVIV